MPTTAVAIVPATMPPDALRAFQRGDLRGLLDAFDNNAEALARFAMETRRRNVATLGAHEAFVRFADSGQLRQVIRPVKLSTKDGTLYQIGGGVKKRPCDPDTGRWIGGGSVRDWEQANGKRVKWTEIELPTDGPAILTFEGFQRCNEVVGASCVTPAVVVVDGEKRTNPYIERREGRNKRLGDVRRIVITQAVVAYAPATGNPVVVNYTLDYDPSKELAAMLARIADDYPEDCYLTTEEEGEEEQAGNKTRWAYHPLYAGVGYLFDLRLDAVRRAYREFAQILSHATRKAQTVCLRNAFKRHPAFSRHHAITDERGGATIPVVGWTSEGDALEQVRRISEALRRGDTALDDVEAEVVDAAGVYEPEEDAESVAAVVVALEAPKVEGSLLERVTDDAAARAAAEPAAALAEGSPEHTRNVLAERVVQGVGYLDPGQAKSIGYDPSAKYDEPQLRALLTQINATLDADAEANTPCA